jgi:hypothetical protein
MKYFDEEKMGEIRDELEKEILQWPGVSSREMMGCLCYLHGKKMIAFLVTDGIVISKLSEQEQKDLSRLSQQEGIFQDGWQNHQQARVGAEDAEEPEDNFALPKEKLPSL